MIKSRMMRLAGHVARIGELIGGKARRKEPLEGPRRRWVDNIIMDLKRDRMGRCGLD
jgi:hypothetical protein